jgi:anti-sigma factor RsiW
MNHEEAAKLLGPYLDGELDLTMCMQLEEHLAGCADCRQKLEAQQELVALIQAEIPRLKAPPFLATRIQAGLRSEGSTADDVPSRGRFFRGWALAGLAAAAVVILAVALFRAQGIPELDRDAVANHVRSLQVNHLMDVASTDQHTVKPWFAGKLDYSPPVVDLASSGYPLVGGRLDVLDHRNVAAIVYQRRKHFINLFIWPSGASSLHQRVFREDGYHAMGWTRSGMNFLAVSELGEGELKDFVQMIQAQTAETRPGE